MKENFTKALESCRVIPGIKNDIGLEVVEQAPSGIVFILYGTVLNIETIVRRAKRSDNLVFVDVDLIEGFSSRPVVVDYLKERTAIDGILSSKAPMIKAAKENDLYSILRFFMIDSISYYNLEKQIKSVKPHCVEVLPGCIPNVISYLHEVVVSKPIVAGGLVCEKETVDAVLKAGATSVSTTKTELWKEEF